MSSDNKEPSKRVEYRGENIRVSRTGGVASRKNISKDGYGATVNTNHGISLHKRLFKVTKSTSEINKHDLTRNQKLLLKVMIERKQANEKKISQESKEIVQSDNPFINSGNNRKGKVIQFSKRHQHQVFPTFIAKNLVIILRKGYNDGISAKEAIYNALVYITNSLWYNSLSIKQMNEVNFNSVKQIVVDTVKANRKKN